MLFTVLSSVLFQLKMEDKGQIVVLILLLASIFPCDCSFPRIPWVMSKLEANFTYLETIKTPCLSQCSAGVERGLAGPCVHDLPTAQQGEPSLASYPDKAKHSRLQRVLGSCLLFRRDSSTHRAEPQEQRTEMYSWQAEKCTRSPHVIFTPCSQGRISEVKKIVHYVAKSSRELEGKSES